MKKLIFLLLVTVIGAGMVFAVSNPEHPLGVLTPETVMAEYNVQMGIVTQPAVLVMVMPATAEPSSFLAVMAANEKFIAIQSIRGVSFSMLVNTGQYWTDTAADFYLRC